MLADADRSHLKQLGRIGTGINGAAIRSDLVEDAEGRFVGHVVEGDQRKLIGGDVDAEWDILDEVGDVVGRVEPSFIYVGE